MSTFKIQCGTPYGSESLCDSCYWAHIQKGFAESEIVSLCAFLRPAWRIPFRVRECTDYSDKRVPSKSDMEDIAWIIRTNHANRQAGFVREETEEDEQVNDESKSEAEPCLS